VIAVLAGVMTGHLGCESVTQLDQQNLRAAADVAGRHPGRARELGIGAEETAR
jgi:hypothetical protein